MISIPNCTIVYTSENPTNPTFDPVTGEPIFTLATSTESFRASLEYSIEKPTFGLQPGKDRTDQLYYGRAELIPSSMPTWYKPGANVEVRFDNSFTAKGYVNFSHLSRLGLDDFFGAPIEILINY